ncbi:MAG: hypothetical protein JOZ54_20075 [Acidobacteria bacterium]|nr:hypothetical protein [Acidobacteriota bacterium]
MFIAALGSAGAEIPAAPPTYGPAEFIQFNPQVVSDGDNFLVLWTDLRASALPNLYATRVSSTGEVLDPTNIRVAEKVTSASAVWTGRSYLVVVTQPTGTFSVAMLDREGRLLLPPRSLNIGAFLASAKHPLATNGSKVVLAYSRLENSALTRHLAVLDMNGEVLESDIALPSDSGDLATPIVTSNGSEFLVLTQATSGNKTTVSMLRLDANGHPLGNQFIALGEGRFPSVASDGNDYVVLLGGQASSQFIARKIARDGTVGDVKTIPITAAPDDTTTLAWNGSEYLGGVITVGDSQTNLQAVRLRSDGTVIDAPFLAGSRASAPAIASNGRRSYVSWVDANPTGNSDVMGRVLAPTPFSDPARLDTSAGAQRHPAGAYDGTQFLTAWEESQNDSGQPRVYFGRVTSTGAHPDGRGIRVTSNETVQRDPRVIYDRTRFLVGWQEQDAIYVRRIDKNGQFIDAAPKAVPGSCHAGDFDMAQDDGTTVLTWVNCTTPDIMVIRFDDNAGTFDPQPTLLAEAENPALHARIAFGFDIALVVWEERIVTPVPNSPEPNFDSQGDVRGASIYVPSMLVLTDPLDIAVTEDEEGSPDVAWDNQEFLVTYNDAEGINGRYVDPFGDLLTDTRIATGESLGSSSVVYDGVGFVVAFNAGDDVFASRVRRRSDSTVLEGKFAVAASSDVESDPNVVLMGTGRVGFLYDRVATEALYGGVPRVFLRLLENIAPRPRPTR